MFCGKFNNTVSFYSCLMLNSSNNGEGFYNWHFFRVCTNSSETRDSICAHFTEDGSQTQIIIAVSVER